MTAKTQKDLGNAQSYFREHLAIGDYYAEGQQVSGLWFGHGAAQLGLSGKVEADPFLALCKNCHPETGERLTQRQMGTREDDGREVGNRRVFYDFTLSPPKSVSIMALIANDERIVQAHHQAVQVALKEFEAFAATRLRSKGANADRITGNFVAALFTHDTSRLLDPHLHSHCVVFNATHDASENRWKALQNAELLRARRFAENLYYHEMARALRSAGYTIVSRARGDFEVAGIPEELVQRFSKRHRQINQALDELLKSKPELAKGNLQDLREALATAERQRKQPDLGQSQLRQLWQEQMTPKEWDALNGLVSSAGKNNVERQSTIQVGSPSDPKTVLTDAVEWAEEHLFDRRSVVDERDLWAEVLGRLRGEPVSIEALKAFTARRGYVRDRHVPTQITRPEVVDRESEIVQRAKDGIGYGRILAPDPATAATSLDPEQRHALSRLCGSRDLVTLFRGAAGTGKSYVLKELVAAIHAGGRETVVLAPQRQQVLALEADGIPSPETVTRFLQRPQLRPGSVVIVDEAGQIGGRQMLQLLRVVEDHGARLVLSGDTRQHGPVEASDALIAIERYSGARQVELRTIRRQDPSLAESMEERRFIERYRQAVAHAAAGRMALSYRELEAMGAITECPADKLPSQLADEFVHRTQAGQTLVVVSQTWDEVRRINEAVRARLKQTGTIAATDTSIDALVPVDLTDAQKRDPRFHGPDRVVVFNQPARGCPAGTRGRFVMADRHGLILDVAGRIITVPPHQISKLSVFQRTSIPVAPGDRLHLKPIFYSLRSSTVDDQQVAGTPQVLGTTFSAQLGALIRPSEGSAVPLPPPPRRPCVPARSTGCGGGTGALGTPLPLRVTHPGHE